MTSTMTMKQGNLDAASSGPGATARRTKRAADLGLLGLLGTLGRSAVGTRVRSPSPTPHGLRALLGAALPTLPATLALVSIVLSLNAQNVIDRQLLVASALCLLALTFRTLDGTPRRLSPKTPPTETNAMTRKPSPTSSHVLIDGTFEGRDAQEILLTLLNTKIDYHARRCFSSQERFGVTDLASERRLEELNAVRSRVRAVLSDALADGQHVRIHSTLELRPVEAPALQGEATSGEGRN